MRVAMKWALARLPVIGRHPAPLERDLVARGRRGDAEAFAELVRLHQDAIYRLALRMVGPDDAEDLAQQAFIKAWQALDRFDGASAFGTWLYRIAVNACLDHLRRLARFRPLPLEEVEWSVKAEDDVAEQVVDAADVDARRAALAWALEQLPSEDRQLLQLRTEEERSYEEIAALLGINSRTVGTRLFRARARLHALITTRLREHGHDLR